MARIVLPGSLGHFTGGETEFDLEAGNVLKLFRLLGERYPALKPHLDQFAVAIDGQLYQDALLQPIPPDSEVHLLPKIVGGG